jgi:Ca2+-binding RTX toxin-like protein
MDLYVSTSGSDSNDGSAGRPFRTIQRAANSATAGTTVHVRPGVYNETINSQYNGTETAPIQFVSDTPGAAVIRPNGASGTIWSAGGDYVTIQGFNVDGTNSPNARVGIMMGGSHVYVRNNEVHHLVQGGANDSNGGAGIVLGGGYFNEVDQNAVGNVVHHVGTATSDRVHGIYHQSTGSIANNTVYSNPGSIGIVLWHDARNIRIDSNNVYDNAVGISVGSGDWYQEPQPADNVTVVNNTVHDNDGAGIQEHGWTGTHNLYQGNVVYANGTNYSLQNGLQPVNGSSTPIPSPDTSGGESSVSAAPDVAALGHITGSAAADVLYGTSGADYMQGAGGDDYMSAGRGNDVLHGGAGRDRLAGGRGADTLYYTNVNEFGDFVYDFQVGQDQIYLANLAGLPTAAQGESWSWLGDGAFTGHALDLRFYHSGRNTFVSADLDGNRTADISIELNGHLELGSSNFVL